MEGFVDWGKLTTSRQAKEKEGHMSSRAVRLAARMHKRAMDSHNETTPDSEGPGDKLSRRFGLE